MDHVRFPRSPVLLTGAIIAVLAAGSAAAEDKTVTTEEPEVTRLAPVSEFLSRSVRVRTRAEKVPTKLQEDLEKGRRMVALRMMR